MHINCTIKAHIILSALILLIIVIILIIYIVFIVIVTISRNMMNKYAVINGLDYSSINSLLIIYSIYL